MIDTHSHLYLEEFDSDRDEAVKRAIEAGVGHLVLPNVDFDTFARMHSMHIDYPDFTSMAMGLHPTSVTNFNDEYLDQIEVELGTKNYVAVGEVGLDLYWSREYIEAQCYVFIKQLFFALMFNLPVIIHCREALTEIIDLIKRMEPSDRPPMVFHSFTGTPAEVKQLLRIADVHFGINGIVTFKNSHLDETVKAIGPERLLLETDCPYLAPVPFRGKRNESSYVKYVEAKVADILDMPIVELDAITDHNARSVFNI
ncbi:MAG: TatD family hydrolase [Muribaculaceae bacterium]